MPDELNRPKQTWPIRFAFDLGKLTIRAHQNFQLGDTGIAKHFNCLLALKPGAKSPVAVYNAIAKGRL